MEMHQSSDKIVNVGKCASTGVEISICYNDFGDPRNPCMLLVMGLYAPGAIWEDAFCERFAAAGYYVIRYDNRDVGLSTHLSDFTGPHVLRMALPHALSFGERVPYTLDDMAADGMNLLTALGISEAHVFGCSMGGMIAQLMAINYKPRVLSLTILFSHASNSDRRRESLSMRIFFLKSSKSETIEDIINAKVSFMQRIAGPVYRPDEEKSRKLVRALLQRSPDDPMGFRRQLAAVQRAKCRVEKLKEITIPTLVLHGMLDELIPYENGAYLASLIGGAVKLVLFPHLGHTIPEELHEDIVQEVLWNAQRAYRA